MSASSASFKAFHPYSIRTQRSSNDHTHLFSKWSLSQLGESLNLHRNMEGRHGLTELYTPNGEVAAEYEFFLSFGATKTERLI